MNPSVGALIPAAGLSSRMGVLKALQALGGRDSPSLLEQCLALCRDCGVAEPLVVTGHRAGVAELDTELCLAGGLLHDIAKGYPRHETTGGEWLRQLGFDQVAPIVAVHKDLDWQPGMDLGERELVHLADKLVRGRWLIGIEQRFAEKLKIFRDDPEAVEAITSRRELALQLAAAVKQATGRRLADITGPLATACFP